MIVFVIGELGKADSSPAAQNDSQVDGRFLFVCHPERSEGSAF
jgi:hypothetical protein